MNRRRFLETGVALGGWTAWTARTAEAAPIGVRREPRKPRQEDEALRLAPPPEGSIRVAFCISPGSNVIDMAGPWEVFQDTMGERGGRHRHPFELATVAAGKDLVRATGGLHLIPDFAVEDVPQTPHVVVVPAMRTSEAVLEWLRETARTADLIMSVCTGAFQLGRAGLLDGLEATTHHEFWDSFAEEFPKVKLERGLRYVEHPRIATAGGLTSGIDLALRVVERYLGTEAAVRTATYMEYRSEEWKRS